MAIDATAHEMRCGFAQRSYRSSMPSRYRVKGGSPPQPLAVGCRNARPARAAVEPAGVPRRAVRSDRIRGAQPRRKAAGDGRWPRRRFVGGHLAQTRQSIARAPERRRHGRRVQSRWPISRRRRRRHRDAVEREDFRTEIHGASNINRQFGNRHLFEVAMPILGALHHEYRLEHELRERTSGVIICARQSVHCQPTSVRSP